MRAFQFGVVAALLALLVGIGAIQAKPVKDDPKSKKSQTPLFKPVEINNELTANDGNDAKLGKPAKKYTVKLTKERTYVIHLSSVAKDFDPYLRLLDKKGDELAEDDDGGGDLNSLLIFSPRETADYEIVAATLDGEVGKFKLTVKEFALKGEAKPRPVEKNGVTITANINQNDVSDLAKLGKLFSFQVKAGQTYTIDLESATADSYLYLFDSRSKIIAQDDDSGGDLNSRIMHRAAADGVIHVLATSLGGDETGEFTLRVRKND